MKLSELKNIPESKMAEKHQDLQDAIANEYNLEDNDPMIQKIIGWLHNDDDEKVDEFMMDHYLDEMPYGTQKARTGDPKNWIADHVSHIFHKYM